MQLTRSHLTTLLFLFTIPTLTAAAAAAAPLPATTTISPPPCVTTPVSHPGPNVHCNVHGHVKHPAPLGKPIYIPPEIAISTVCRGECFDSHKCEAYEYSEHTRECQLFKKTLEEMGLVEGGKGTEVLYDRACFASNC